MKASSHEKHAKKPWKNQKKQKKTKISDPWTGSGERPGRGHGSELFVFFFLFSRGCCPNYKKQWKNQKENTKFRPMPPA